MTIHILNPIDGKPLCGFSEEDTSGHSFITIGDMIHKDELIKTVNCEACKAGLEEVGSKLIRGIFGKRQRKVKK